MDEPEDTVHKVRSYDLSITYDFYYQTPRLWLIGYNEDGQLLKEEEIF
jgi:ubiquitin-like-conjugating enzyme ATG3